MASVTGKLLALNTGTHDPCQNTYWLPCSLTICSNTVFFFYVYLLPERYKDETRVVNFLRDIYV